MSSRPYKQGDVAYVWIPYTKDLTNRLLGSIVQVELEVRCRAAWRCRVIAMGKPTATYKEGSASCFARDEELARHPTEIVTDQVNHYKEFLNEQLARLYTRGVDTETNAD